MKTTSKLTKKYPGHNTQKTAFPLCALPSDTPNRDNANFRKTDITALQMEFIVNAKLAEGCSLPAHYVIHIAAPVCMAAPEEKPNSLPLTLLHMYPYRRLGLSRREKNSWCMRGK